MVNKHRPQKASAIKYNKKDFLSILDFSYKELTTILSLAQKLKKELKTRGKNPPYLLNKNLVMIFEKPSLRTRLSFEIGMTQLSGHAVYLGPSDIQMGVRESVTDVAKVASSMGNLIMARTFKHKTVVELAAHSQVPVINGLSDLEHPCQTLADLLTIIEFKKSLKNLKVTFIGDGENNVAHSLALGVSLLGGSFSIAAPKGFWMKKEFSIKATQLAKSFHQVFLETSDPREAVRGADIVYTDTWISMGDEAEKEKRLKVFKPYQVTEDLIKLAKKDALFMHDLPAYRGNEVATEVIDGSQSVVFPQAENRLHAQKALLLYLIGIKL